MVIGLCERFHCLPSQLEKEDTSLVRMLKIVAAARQDEQEAEDDGA
jgi:hypothetical protein